MSFNRLNYDTCAYKQNLYQSVGPGEYRLTEPPNSCDICLPETPHIRLQKQGVSVRGDMPLIDVDSELMNLTRPATNCPSKKYIPDGSQCGLTNPNAPQNKNLEHGSNSNCNWGESITFRFLLRNSFNLFSALTKISFTSSCRS